MDGGGELERQEARLIAAACGGAVEEFTELVYLHQSPIRAFLGRVLQSPATVDDVAQETFLSAFRSLGTYDANRSFRSWLFGIARNQACKHLRRESRRRTHESNRLQTQIAQWAADLAESEQAEDAERRLADLQQCIAALPKSSARLIRQHYFEQMSAGDIAKLLGRSENAVRILLFRIRQGLRDCLLGRAAAKEA